MHMYMCVCVHIFDIILLVLCLGVENFRYIYVYTYDIYTYIRENKYAQMYMCIYKYITPRFWCSLGCDDSQIEILDSQLTSQCNP